METDITIWGWSCLAILTVGLGLLSYIDLKTGYLPDVIVGPLAVAGLAVAVIGSPIGITWVEALIGAALNAGIFYGLRWVVSRMKGREAMGLGDVKLVGAAGFWLGPWGLPYIMAVAGLSTLAGAGLASVVTRRKVWQGEMPLGPGLALGIWLVFVLMMFGVLTPSP